MTSDGHACAIRLSEIAGLRNRLEICADLLPADLALTGLLDDLIEVSTAAIELAEQSTRAVYPLVRTEQYRNRRRPNSLSQATTAWV